MRKQLVMLAAGMFLIPQSAVAMPDGEVLRDGSATGASVNIDNGGLHVDGGSIDATINAQVQTGYSYTSWDDSEARGLDNTSEFDVYSARLEVAGDAENGFISYKLEYDFVNGVQGDGSEGGSLLDGWAQLNFDEMSVLVGQTKTPFSRQQLAEGNQLQFTSRSLVTQAFEPGRDQGLIIHGDLGDLAYAIGVNNGESLGEGQNSDGFDTQMQGAAHVSMNIGDYGSRAEEGDMREGDRPFASTIGAGVLFGSGDIAGVDFDSTSLNADVGIRNAGLDISGEFFYQSFDPDGGSTSDDMGFHVQVGQMFGDYEAAFRFAYGDPDSDGSAVFRDGIDDVQEYSLALSRFFNGHNSKVVAGVSIVETGATDGGTDTTDVQVDVVLTQRL